MTADGAREMLPTRRVRRLAAQGLDRVVTLLAVGLLAVAIVPSLSARPPAVALAAISPLVWWGISALWPKGLPEPALAATLVLGVAAAAMAATFATPVAGVPGLFMLISLLAAPVVPLWVGATAATVAAAVFGLGAVAGALGFTTTLVLVGAAAASTAVGLSRRQSRRSAERERAAAIELVAAHQALAQSAAEEERRRIARNLHDVLAHSLGGLVIQLDAVEGLLEAGRVDEARVRAAASRRLAAEGLTEARAAVQVLNDGDVDLAVLARQIESLVATERELGVDVEAELHVTDARLKPEEMVAMQGAAREALTNARKHSPGGKVRVTLSSADGVVTLTVTNAITDGGPLSGTGSGRGLAGMRARFSSLPGGGVEIVQSPARFSICAKVRES